MKLLVRLNIYKSSDSGFGELLFTSKPQNIITGKNDLIVFSLSDVNLKFSKDGFYLQLEHLGAVNDLGEFVDCNDLFFARIDISDKLSKQYNITSFKVNANGNVDSSEPLNYKQVFGENGKDGNYFLNYRFTYYDNN